MTDCILSHIFKSFNGIPVLSDISLTLPAGSVTCLDGQSGSGKTTLLNVIAGLMQADSGQISGRPDRIAFVFQEDRLCEDFSAVSNVRMVTGKSVSKQEILSHLKELGLDGSMNKPVRDYSGGMKRRVAIARAICCGADLILLDEPFKGLDPALRSQVIRYIQAHTTGKTLLCVTHNREEAAALGGRLLHLGDLKHESESSI
ncbi:MAG: ATP-binding cassette domain-containing protein [Oscillospiraceae bacterium]|nr:ATP-binding cassette domain-containing protein [Oscillospiraceae bacterium]